jgi:hypothetical protein
MHEAARRSGMTEPTLRSRVRCGEIAAFADPTDRRVRLIRERDLDAYVSSIVPIRPEDTGEEIADDGRA